MTGETPECEHESEWLVWQRLAATVSTDTMLVPNPRLTSELMDHELDLVVLTRCESSSRMMRADRLTLEQASLLRVTRLLHRMGIRGGAGSGTTILALTQAKDLTRGQGDRKPQRVALVCYSLGLSGYVRYVTETPRGCWTSRPPSSRRQSRRSGKRLMLTSVRGPDRQRRVRSTALVPS